MKKIVRNQEGFTLIEVIAVLVILAILAAVAIPKYLDMADEARKKAAQGALAAAASDVVLKYSNDLLINNGNHTAALGVAADGTDVNLGDYLYSASSSGNTVTVTISAPANSDIIDGLNTDDLSKEFNLGD